MIICHSSDSHGVTKRIFSRMLDADLYVNTGDFFPNACEDNSLDRVIDPVIEAEFQQEWLLKDTGKGSPLVRLMDWYAGRPFIFVPGNHDYIDLAEQMRLAGYGNAYTICVDGIELLGLRFAGFGEVEYSTGEWNNEVSTDVLRALTQRTSEAKPSVLFTHAPPGSILDMATNGARFGNPHITSWFNYGDWTVKLHMFGHIHRGQAMMKINGTWFVNGACATKYFDFNPDAGTLDPR